MSSATRALVIMAKKPAAGETKTRLTPELSAEQAAELYECFLADTISTLAGRTDCALFIAVTSAQASEYFEVFAPGIAQVSQVGDSLGERLDSVLTACLDLGFDQAFAIGSDSPDLPAGHLGAAFDLLGGVEADVVLGPTDDGGYYLIGWKQRWSPVVVDVVMSTSSVLQDTLVVAQHLGANVVLAPSWYDVDTPDDLPRLRTSLGETSTSATAQFLSRS